MRDFGSSLGTMRRRDAVVGLAALFTPRLAHAEATAVRRVGILVLGNPPPELLLRTLREALRGRGYEEGRNIAFVPRSAEGNADRLQDAARELVRLRVDVVVAWQTPAVAAAKAATRTIPIVMAGAADPVGNGFIASHARPGGNITGISGAGGEVFGKGLELLREAVPKARRFAVLANATDPFTPAFLRLLQASARAARVEVNEARVNPADDLRGAFAGFMRLPADGLIVQPSLVGPKVADLALEHRLPSVSGFRSYAERGGLMSYSLHQRENFVQTARYVDLILKGANPAELPVAAATKFELVINLGTAKRLGLEVPPSLLIRADELIE